jgi:uncharacterized RDD family membrane protein YckC
MTRGGQGNVPLGAPAPETSFRDPPPANLRFDMPQPGALRLPDGVPVSSLWPRLLARGVDWILKSLITFLVAFREVHQLLDISTAWQEVHPVPTMADVMSLAADESFVAASRRLQLIGLLVSLIYTVPMVALWGGTPGKRLFGLRVRPVDVDGLPGWRRSMLRWLSREGAYVLIPLIGAIYLLLDSVWPLRDPRRQALHDKLPRTVVVGRQRSSSGDPFR